MSNIEYLYRYTSLESLALILKSRQIRLNPLDKMDDLQEQKIESLFIETTFSEINDNCVTKPIAISFTRNKTVHTIKKELNGEYYKLMYEKRVYNQSHPNS